ncbi:hypothetical protein [Pollutimonas harenae]|uniref:Uncharacterized protein n=1 Tax=Pollutimonas harenae TaxID=657015 RepID=A0A853GTV5_9BURK|nr:hypothetical protein [Pollutimonas harenae]NYT85681.1 hypothetical protein [Pollutimonas harenae]TEA70756.1 hypothetical protein ERD84_08785 [Pollutimonas harenae]
MGMVKPRLQTKPESNGSGKRYKNCAICELCKCYYISFLSDTQAGKEIRLNTFLFTYKHQIYKSYCHQEKIYSHACNDAGSESFYFLLQGLAAVSFVTGMPPPCTRRSSHTQQNYPDLHGRILATKPYAGRWRVFAV